VFPDRIPPFEDSLQARATGMSQLGMHARKNWVETGKRDREMIAGAPFIPV